MTFYLLPLSRSRGNFTVSTGLGLMMQRQMSDRRICEWQKGLLLSSLLNLFQGYPTHLLLCLKADWTRSFHGIRGFSSRSARHSISSNARGGRPRGSLRVLLVQLSKRNHWLSLDLSHVSSLNLKDWIRSMQNPWVLPLLIHYSSQAHVVCLESLLQVRKFYM